VCALHGYTYNSSICAFLAEAPSEAACTLRSARVRQVWVHIHTYSSSTRKVSEPSCMCAERGCWLAWLGFVCAPYGFTSVLLYVLLYPYFPSRTAFAWSEAACMRGLAWLRVRPVTAWLQVQPLYLNLPSRAACAPSWAVCTLGLTSRRPRMATHTSPLSVFSEPNGTCAERGHVYPWSCLIYACMPTQTVHFFVCF
jgi:hypothetical protein